MTAKPAGIKRACSGSVKTTPKLEKTNQAPAKPATGPKTGKKSKRRATQVLEGREIPNSLGEFKCRDQCVCDDPVECIRRLVADLFISSLEDADADADVTLATASIKPEVPSTEPAPVPPTPTFNDPLADFDPMGPLIPWPQQPFELPVLAFAVPQIDFDGPVRGPEYECDVAPVAPVPARRLEPDRRAPAIPRCLFEKNAEYSVADWVPTEDWGFLHPRYSAPSTPPELAWGASESESEVELDLCGLDAPMSELCYTLGDWPRPFACDVADTWAVDDCIGAYRCRSQGSDHLEELLSSKTPIWARG